jgi:hypothetical protein
MRRCLILYSCSIVFAVWAVVWALGLHGVGVTVAFLTLAAITLAAGEIERSRIREEIRRGRR